MFASETPTAATFTPEVVAGGVERTEVTAGTGGVWWLEHSYDAGRSYVMHAPPEAPPRAVTPGNVDVGTLAWEYGGGSYLVTADGSVVYSDRDDQRLYRVPPAGSPMPLTPSPGSPRGARFADGSVASGGRWAAYVRESHGPGEPVRHELVAVSLDRSWGPRLLAAGQDFYAAPRISPDGSALAWLSWSKPRMPWDGTELWLADIRPDLSLGEPRRIAGGEHESVLTPQWSPDGELHWVSDASGWWNLYRRRESAAQPICPDRAEYAVPPWQHGRRGYGFLGDGSIVAVRIRDAVHELVTISAAGGAARPITAELTWIADGHLSCHGTTVALAGATPIAEPAVLAIDTRSERITMLAADEPSWDTDVVRRIHNAEVRVGVLCRTLCALPVNVPETEAPRLAINEAALIIEQLARQIVKRPLAHAVGPPKRRGQLRPFEAAL